MHLVWLLFYLFEQLFDVTVELLWFILGFYYWIGFGLRNAGIRFEYYMCVGTGYHAWLHFNYASDNLIYRLTGQQNAFSSVHTN